MVKLRTPRAPATAARWIEIDLGAVRAAGPRPDRAARHEDSASARAAAGSRVVQSEAGRGARCAPAAPRSSSWSIRTSGRPPRPGRARRLRRQGALREGDRGGAARRPGGRRRAQPQGHARRAARRPHASARFRPARTRATSCSTRARRRAATSCRAGARGGHVEPAAPRAAPRAPPGSPHRADPGQRGHAPRASSSDGAYDALILAAAGLERLGLSPSHATPLDPSTSSCPRWGRASSPSKRAKPTGNCLKLLRRRGRHSDAGWQALAERAFLPRLGAGCHTPWRATRASTADASSLTGLVASLDGATVLAGDGERAGLAGRRALGRDAGGRAPGRGARRRCSMRAAGDQVMAEAAAASRWPGGSSW